MSIEERERLLLATYAMHSSQSAGRKHPEPAHAYRGAFQRDRDRIVHSAAYRRLSAKTQVFTGELGDYHRTRLTHTLEVSSIARTLARTLRLNEDLVEALAQLHDLGHPPFGHAGEDVLNDCLRHHGGFSHNGQGLRVVEELETRYPEFPGLNLSIETLESQQARTDKSGGGPAPLLEAQVVEAADSVAYDTHDADDALELGLLSLGDLLTTSLWAHAGRRVHRKYKSLHADDLRRAILHELIDWQVGELISRAESRLARGDIRTASDVRAAEPIILAGSEVAQQKMELEQFLRERVYTHPEVMRHRQQAQALLAELFAFYAENPERLPSRFLDRAEQFGRERSVADYLADMTDRYATREHHRLFGTGTNIAGLEP